MNRKFKRFIDRCLIFTVPNLALAFCLFYFGYQLIISNANDTTQITISSFIFCCTLSALSFSWSNNQLLPRKLKVLVTMGGVRFLTASFCLIFVTVFKYAYSQVENEAQIGAILFTLKFLYSSFFIVALILARWGVNRLTTAIVLYGKYNYRLEKRAGV